MSITSLALTLLGATSIPLPGGPPVAIDYVAYDAAHHRLWVPAGNTGNIDVVDTTTGKVSALSGLATRPAPKPGRPNLGPSSASVGEGVVWVGNRGDNKVCAFDARTLEKRSCAQLSLMPDGVEYVGATHELWVTSPHDQTITVVDVKGKTPGAAASIKLDGAPEGYASDGARGLFYTNLEDKNRTLTIDMKTRKVIADWPSGCDGDGPRGIAIDVARRRLFVACTDGAVALDLAHDGKVLGRIKTGKGVDNIDYSPAQRRLYIASREDATLTVVSAADDGALKSVATAPTAKGARNAVVDEQGNAYVPDSAGGSVIVVKIPGP